MGEICWFYGWFLHFNGACSEHMLCVHAVIWTYIQLCLWAIWFFFFVFEAKFLSLRLIICTGTSTFYFIRKIFSGHESLDWIFEKFFTHLMSTKWNHTHMWLKFTNHHHHHWSIGIFVLVSYGQHITNLMNIDTKSKFEKFKLTLNSLPREMDHVHCTILI